MHCLAVRSHRVGREDLRLPPPNVNHSKKPMNGIFCYGDDDFVQIEDVQVRGPPADIVVGVTTAFRQSGIEVA